MKARDAKKISDEKDIIAEDKQYKEAIETIEEVVNNKFSIRRDIIIQNLMWNVKAKLQHDGYSVYSIFGNNTDYKITW